MIVKMLRLSESFFRQPQRDLRRGGARDEYVSVSLSLVIQSFALTCERFSTIVTAQDVAILIERDFMRKTKTVAPSHVHP